MNKGIFYLLIIILVVLLVFIITNSFSFFSQLHNLQPLYYGGNNEKYNLTYIIDNIEKSNTDDNKFLKKISEELTKFKNLLIEYNNIVLNNKIINYYIATQTKLDVFHNKKMYKLATDDNINLIEINLNFIDYKEFIEGGGPKASKGKKSKDTKKSNSLTMQYLHETIQKIDDNLEDGYKTFFENGEFEIIEENGKQLIQFCDNNIINNFIKNEDLLNSLNKILSNYPQNINIGENTFLPQTIQEFIKNKYEKIAKAEAKIDEDITKAAAEVAAEESKINKAAIEESKIDKAAIEESKIDKAAIATKTATKIATKTVTKDEAKIKSDRLNSLFRDIWNDIWNQVSRSKSFNYQLIDGLIKKEKTLFRNYDTIKKDYKDINLKEMLDNMWNKNQRCVDFLNNLLDKRKKLLNSNSKLKKNIEKFFSLLYISVDETELKVVLNSRLNQLPQQSQPQLPQQSQPQLPQQSQPQLPQQSQPQLPPLQKNSRADWGLYYDNEKIQQPQPNSRAYDNKKTQQPQLPPLQKNSRADGVLYDNEKTQQPQPQPQPNFEDDVKKELSRLNITNLSEPEIHNIASKVKDNGFFMAVQKSIISYENKKIIENAYNEKSNEVKDSLIESMKHTKLRFSTSSAKKIEMWKREEQKKQEAWQLEQDKLDEKKKKKHEEWEQRQKEKKKKHEEWKQRQEKKKKKNEAWKHRQEKINLPIRTISIDSFDKFEDLNSFKEFLSTIVVLSYDEYLLKSKQIGDLFYSGWLKRINFNKQKVFNNDYIISEQSYYDLWDKECLKLLSDFMYKCFSDTFYKVFKYKNKKSVSGGVGSDDDENADDANADDANADDANADDANADDANADDANADDANADANADNAKYQSLMDRYKNYIKKIEFFQKKINKYIKRQFKIYYPPTQSNSNFLTKQTIKMKVLSGTNVYIIKEDNKIKKSDINFRKTNATTRFENEKLNGYSITEEKIIEYIKNDLLIDGIYSIFDPKLKMLIYLDSN